MASDNRSVPRWLKYAVLPLLCFGIYVCSNDYTSLRMLHAVFDLALPDACFLLPGEYSLLLDLNDYAPLDKSNCRDVGAPLHQLMGSGIIADSATLDAVRRLAWTDAVGSAALVVVCLLLAIHLWLRGRLSGRVQLVLGVCRFVLYGVLLAAAVYRGLTADLLDVRGSALALCALIFIELNVLRWQLKTQREAGKPT